MFDCDPRFSQKLCGAVLFMQHVNFKNYVLLENKHRKPTKITYYLDMSP